MSELNDLITKVETRLKPVLDIPGWSVDAMRARNTGYRTIMADLERTEAAKFKEGNPYQMTMAGIRVSCTSGMPGLLSAWCRKARRQLNQQKEGAVS